MASPAVAPSLAGYPFRRRWQPFACRRRWLTVAGSHCLPAVACSCSKSFWDSPLVEGPERPVRPKTTTFCLVLGFTTSRQPSRAHQSQNDLEQHYSGPSVALPAGLSPLPFPVSPLPVFLTCNVGKNIGLPRTFSSGRVTSGNCQPAFQASKGSCSKSFWDLPPHRRPCKACPSQNDDFLPRFGIHPLWKAFHGTSIPKRF